jgi:glutamate dehydrogenase/leucine dehydrogenase
MDDGFVHIFRGYRVLHSTVRGPGKGGVRFHPEAGRRRGGGPRHLDDLEVRPGRRPVRGRQGRGGVRSANAVEGEKERITRRFTVALGDLIGPHTDIPAPDLYTDAQTMAWMYDTYSTMHPGQPTSPSSPGSRWLGRPARPGREPPPRVPSSPPSTSSNGRDPRALLAGAPPGGHPGLRRAGRAAAHFFHEAGAIIVAVSDSGGGVYRQRGLDPSACSAITRTPPAAVRGFNGNEAISPAGVLEVPCDILIPAALENQITSANAARVDARLVVEAANGPTTPAADAILADRGVKVLPDILANAGGVVVSYFEWAQNIENQRWDDASVVTEGSAPACTGRPRWC